MKKNKKIKIIGGEGINWSLDKNFLNVKNFFSEISDIKIVNDYFSADFYYLLWYNQIFFKDYKWALCKIKLCKLMLKKKVVAVVTNDLRWFPERFDNLRKIVDLWVVYSDKIGEFVAGKGANFIKIPNYVSSEKFYHINNSSEQIAKNLSIDYSVLKNKIKIGSFQRDSLHFTPFFPRWEKNPDLLIEICLRLPREKIVLVLAGPLRHYIVGQCKKYKIPYVFVGKEEYISNNINDIGVNILSEEKINLLYNLIDFYIVNSKADAAPKAIAEACLSKTLIFSTDVGLAKEYLDGKLIFSEHDLSPIIDYVASLESERGEMQKIISGNYERVLKTFNEENFIRLHQQLLDKVNSI